jgi:hypothetical protein
MGRVLDSAAKVIPAAGPLMRMMAMAARAEPEARAKIVSVIEGVS